MRSLLLPCLAGISLLLPVSLLVGGEEGRLLFGALAMAFPVGLSALGALRGGRLRPGILALLAFLLLTLEGSYLGMVLLRGRLLDGPWLGGLPLAVVLFLGGIWLLPLLVVSVGYAVTFDPAPPEGMSPDRASGRDLAGEG